MTSAPSRSTRSSAQPPPHPAARPLRRRRFACSPLAPIRPHPPPRRSPPSAGAAQARRANLAAGRPAAGARLLWQRRRRHLPDHPDQRRRRQDLSAVGRYVPLRKPEHQRQDLANRRHQLRPETADLHPGRDAAGHRPDQRQLGQAVQRQQHHRRHDPVRPEDELPLSGLRSDVPEPGHDRRSVAHAAQAGRHPDSVHQPAHGQRSRRDGAHGLRSGQESGWLDVGRVHGHVQAPDRRRQRQARRRARLRQDQRGDLWRLDVDRRVVHVRARGAGRWRDVRRRRPARARRSTRRRAWPRSSA